MRRNQAAPYVPMGARDRMVRVSAAGQPPAVDARQPLCRHRSRGNQKWATSTWRPHGPLRAMSPWMARPQGQQQNWRRRTKKFCSLLSLDPPISPPGGSVGVVQAKGGGLGLGGVASAFCADCPPPPPGLSGSSLGGSTLPLPHAPSRMRTSAGRVLSSRPPLKCCTWVQSCQAHSFLGPFSALGATVRWG